MLSEQLLTELHKLSRAEKLQIMKILANDLAVEQEALEPTRTYEVWSPYDSAGAARQLMELLERDSKR